HFVQGVDVWLNNPRRPLEASGTSGQKVVLNGGLNLSVLDGWWAEAYDGVNGFAIGSGKTHSNMSVHDTRDGEDLMRTLRDEVIPLYYQRDRDGLPRGWIKRMKRTIRTLGWRFNADRMVMDYTLKCYVPAAGGTSSDMRMWRGTVSGGMSPPPKRGNFGNRNWSVIIAAPAGLCCGHKGALRPRLPPCGW